MTSPKNSSTDRDGQRTYTWQGVEYPSVTSVLSVVSKPALVPGARKVQAEEILSRPGHYVDHLIDHGFDKTRLYASRQAKAVWDATSDLGSRVHADVERLFNGHQISQGWVEDDVMPYLKQFDEWWRKAGFTCLHSEVTGYNRTYNFAGQCDLILRGYCTDPFSEDTMVVDLKSGTGIYPETFVPQVAAYRQFEFLVINDQEVEMPKTDGAAILHLRPDKCELIPVDAGYNAFKAFLAARDLWDWVYRDSKEALGAGPQ